MTKATYLTTHLRESAPYLKDAGWRESAKLLLLAADEIEALRARVQNLEEMRTASSAIVSPTSRTASLGRLLNHFGAGTRGGHQSASVPEN